METKNERKFELFIQFMAIIGLARRAKALNSPSNITLQREQGGKRQTILSCTTVVDNVGYNKKDAQHLYLETNKQ